MDIVQLLKPKSEKRRALLKLYHEKQVVAKLGTAKVLKWALKCDMRFVT